MVQVNKHLLANFSSSLIFNDFLFMVLRAGGAKMASKDAATYDEARRLIRKAMTEHKLVLFVLL